MRLRGRLDRVTKQMTVDRLGTEPLTVVLHEASAEHPPRRCERTSAAGLPVLEIVFDPAAGPVALPAPPYKLVQGVDPVDLV
jgi:hypothetical protein